MVTTFVVQTSQSLQVDNSQVIASLLYELINIQRATANESPVDDVPRSGINPFTAFHPNALDAWVNGLWFTSLSLSLITALVVVVAKQWIHHYISIPSGTARDRGRLRHFRFMGLEEWHVPIIIGLLPVLLHVSLGIFIIGLIVFVSRLHVVISAVIGGLGFVALAFYIVTNLLPLIHPQCPYRSPLTVFIYPSYSYFRNRFYSIPNNLLSKSSFRDVEQGYVTQMSDIIDARTILWLHSATSDPNVQNLAIETTSSLPLQSTELVSRDFSNIMFHCRAEIKACLLSPTGFVFDHNSSELPENIKKGKLDRLLRTYLRFGYRYHSDLRGPSSLHLDHNIDPRVIQAAFRVMYECPITPDGFAHYISTIFPSEQSQQPIVWAHVLCDVLGPSRSHLSVVDNFQCDITVYGLLFQAIPFEYWSTDYRETDVIFRSFAMEMWSREGPRIRLLDNWCSNSNVSIRTAISWSLYPLLDELLCRLFTGGWTSISIPTNSPEPLQLLLAATQLSQMSHYPYEVPFLSIVLSRFDYYISSLAQSKNKRDQTTREWQAISQVAILVIQSDVFGTLAGPDQEHLLRVWTNCVDGISQLNPALGAQCTKWCSEPLVPMITTMLFADHQQYSSYLIPELFFSHSLFATAIYEGIISTDSFRRVEESMDGTNSYADLGPHKLVRGYVNGLAALPDDLRVLAMDYLFQYNHLLMTFKVLAWYFPDTLWHLGSLRPQDQTWDAVFRTFDNRSSESEFWRPSQYFGSDWEQCLKNIAKFQRHMRDGCPGASYGNADEVCGLFYTAHIVS